MSELDLIGRAKKGDQQAFAELFESYRPALVRFASPMVGNEAEDAVQTASVGALEKIGTYDSAKGATFSTWLHTRVKSICLDMIRKNRNWAALPVHDEEGEEIQRYRPKEGGPSPDERDGLMNAILAEEGQRERAEAVRVSQANFLEEAKREIENWPNDQILRHGPRIVDDPRAAQLLDLLTRAGGRINKSTFVLIVNICAELAERPREAYTPSEARAAIKILEIIGNRFREAPDGSGFETMTENIEKILPMLRPVSSRRGKKTALHYDLMSTLGPVFRRFCGKPVRPALVLAAEITYGKSRTLADVKAARKRR